jgi:hypothetical protein
MEQRQFGSGSHRTTGYGKTAIDSHQSLCYSGD